MIQDDDNLRITSTIWRRHSASCPQRAHGRYATNCDCPLWGDGCVDSARVMRQSLQTRNIRVARQRLAKLLEDYIDSLDADPHAAPKVIAIGETRAIPAKAPEAPYSTIQEDLDTEDPSLLANAAEAYLDNCATNGVKPPTIRKYRNTLNKLCAFAEQYNLERKKMIHRVADFEVIDLDRFRASRKIAPITSLKELETLRGFWAYCAARDLCAKNTAALIKAPTIIDQNNIVPYTQDEVQAIIDACSTFGLYDYERKRALALVHTLRYTALRISDVALLRRDRISHTKSGWRIFLHTTKNNAPVFLPIPGQLVEALHAAQTPRGADKDCAWYFWNGKSKHKSIISVISETLAAVFKKSGVQGAHAHRFRHTLATELLGAGASFEEVADILGNTPEIVRKHYAKWSRKRQERVDELMAAVHKDAWRTGAP